MKGFLGFEDLQVEAGGQGEDAIQNANTEERQSLWKQLSQYIGKDVTSMISLPAWVFEPISFLQIMAEPMEYAELLIKVCKFGLRALDSCFVFRPVSQKILPTAWPT